MADFIVIADMGEQFDRRKEILENTTEEEADNLAYELANELYSSYEGVGGIYTFDDFWKNMKMIEQPRKKVMKNQLVIG